MRKLTLLMISFVLTMSVMAGCRRGSGAVTTEPSQTTQPTTAPTTAPTTLPTIPPTTAGTMPTMTMPSEDPAGTDATAGTDSTAGEIPGRSRRTGGR